MNMRSFRRPLYLTIPDMEGEMAARYSHEAGSATMHYSSKCERSGLLDFSTTHRRTSKNLWHRQYVRREIFWYVEYFFIRQNFKKEPYFLRKP